MKKSGTKKRVGRPSKSHGNVPAFLQKTYDFLDVPEYNNLICWNKEGNAFIVKNISGFADEVLPKYFKHNNFASFVRQLNMYDFHKIRHEDNENEFRHKFFKRGQRNLLSQIKRKSHEAQAEHFEPLASTNRTIELSKVKKETQHFSTELGILKGRQSELEKTIKNMNTQNQKLTDENKLLWGELVKNREKYEKKMEKMMLYLCSVVQNPDFHASLESTLSKKALPNSETYQADNNKFDILQKLEQLDAQKNEGDSIKFNQAQKLINAKNREGELATSTPLGLRRRPQVKSYAPEPNKTKRTSNKRPLPTETLEENNLKGEVPAKQIKTETASSGFSMPLSSFNSRHVVNNLENDMDLPLQPSLSRIMSLNDHDSSLLGATSINAKKYNGNGDDIFASPKPFMNGNKEDDVSSMYHDLVQNGFRLDNKDEGFAEEQAEVSNFNSNLFPDNFNFPFGDSNLSLKHQNSGTFS